MRRSFVRAGSLFREPFLTAKDRPVGRFTGHIHSPSGLRYKVQSGVLFFHSCHESSASSGERDSKGSSYSLCLRFPRSIDRLRNRARSMQVSCAANTFTISEQRLKARAH